MTIRGKSGCLGSVTVAETNGLAQLGGGNGGADAAAFTGGGAGAGVSSPDVYVNVVVYVVRVSCTGCCVHVNQPASVSAMIVPSATRDARAWIA